MLPLPPRRSAASVWISTTTNRKPHPPQQVPYAAPVAPHTAIDAVSGALHDPVTQWELIRRAFLPFPS